MNTNCDTYRIVGQRFALLEMKAMIASLIHSFCLEPVDYLKDMRIGADIILRPLNSHHIKFIPVESEQRRDLNRTD
jgi:hypothetical protein